MLGENGSSADFGRDMWVLSHLTYSLVWVLETYQMYVVGRDGGGEDMEALRFEEEVFSRLAG
jgi:hypothetical protein